MRIQKIELSWFRGAADLAGIEPAGGNLVLYGENGTGKSSFVDAIEYLVNEGKVGHLSHEYSGARQEKGLRNTHTPAGNSTSVRLQFVAGAAIEAKIAEDGRPTITAAPSSGLGLLQSWPKERLILRQDELSRFIEKPKAEKYSAVLPLLGLAGLESAAENIRQLRKIVAEGAALSAERAELAQVEGRLRDAFATHDPSAVEGWIATAEMKYGVAGGAGLGSARLVALGDGIEARVSAMAPLSAAQSKAKQVVDAAILESIRQAVSATDALAKAAPGAMDRLINVLSRTAEFLEGGQNENVDCPACGRPIPREELQAHVTSELARLGATRAATAAEAQARAKLGRTFDIARGALGHADLGGWLGDPGQGPARDFLKLLGQPPFVALSAPIPVADLSRLEASCEAALGAITSKATEALPDFGELLGDKTKLAAAYQATARHGLAGRVRALEELGDKLSRYETSIRTEIRLQSAAALRGISTSVQRLWTILHPGEAIEELQLDASPGDDKAIDITLKFHGVSQRSPRLSLSEGHRNSLGLCVFLSLALADGDPARPIILDDVVSSLDRGHRGLLIDLISKELQDRQILLFTHDREWFGELRFRLPAGAWAFRTLTSWDDPVRGIQVAPTQGMFADAIALKGISNEAAANRARAAMDQEMAMVADKLAVRLPFMRGAKNDRRGAAEFLEAIGGAARTGFLVVASGSKEAKPDPSFLAKTTRARDLLINWANPASHDGAISSSELAALIKACEEVVDAFVCPGCKKNVWFAEQGGADRFQCQCGAFRWRA